VMGNGLLVWIGLRSYGLYLWHWPIYCITRPGVDIPWGVYPTLVLRLVLTVICTELSFRLIEVPVRNGGLGRWIRTLRGPQTERREQRRRITAAAALATVLVLVPVGSSMATAKKPVNEIEQSLREGQAVIGTNLATAPDATTPDATTPDDPAPTATTATSVKSATSVVSSVDSTVAGAATTAPAASVTAAPPASANPGAAPVLAIGDSVMLGAAPQLVETFGTSAIIDAKVGRNLHQAIELVAAYKQQGKLGEKVVLHLGNNGSFTAKGIADMMALLSDVDRVVWIDLKLPGAVEGKVNGVLISELPKYPNARLADWLTASKQGDQSKIFYKDATHLRPAGARLFAQMVQQVLNGP
jgi:hypothetical protein